MSLNLADVQSTKDYNLFKTINYNREVMGNRVESIVESINKYGFILPILVNKDFYVVDGQHRLEAAKRCNSIVSYIQFNCDNSMLPILVSTVNTTSKNWTNEDYLNMWRYLDKEAYVYISDIMDDYRISLAVTLRLAGFGGNALKKFKSGDFTLTSSQKSRLMTRIMYLDAIRNHNHSFSKFNYSPSFVRAVANIVKNPKYNHERMMAVLDRSPGCIVKCNRGDEYIELFEGIYNYKRKDRIKFSSEGNN